MGSSAEALLQHIQALVPCICRGFRSVARSSVVEEGVTRPGITVKAMDLAKAREMLVDASDILGARVRIVLAEKSEHRTG
jgi:hypothetical protein